MNTTNNRRLTGNAKVLRKTMTKEEKHLWYDFLKKLPITVNRQKVIGEYIVDFYCAEARLVIELDGSQHGSKKGLQEDKKRDTYLNSLGIKVVRYPNLHITRYFDAVCKDIIKRLPEEYHSIRVPIKDKVQIKGTQSQNKPSPGGEGGIVSEHCSEPLGEWQAILHGG